MGRFVGEDMPKLGDKLPLQLCLNSARPALCLLLSFGDFILLLSVIKRTHFFLNERQYFFFILSQCGKLDCYGSKEEV